jgi:tetratricopeptide (TPR) repeat protein
MDYPLAKIGAILRRKRQSLQKTIEDMVDSNISRSTISNAERGLPNVTEAMYRYYAEKLGLGSTLAEVIAKKDQQEQTANEELQEIENTISIDPHDAKQQINHICKKYEIDKRDNLHPFTLYLYGRCAYEQKKWKKARGYYEQALELLKQNAELKKTNLQTACYNELSRVSFFENELEESLQHVIDGLNVFQVDGERLRFQYHCMLNKSIYLQRLSRADQALDAIESHYQAINKLSTDEILSVIPLINIIETHNVYAVILSNLKLYERALTFAFKGLKIADNHRSYNRSFTLRATIGTIYFKMGVSDKAKKYFLQAFSMRNTITYEYTLTRALIYAGQLYTQQSEWMNAIQALEEAVALSKKNNDLPSLIDSYISLGDCYLQQNNYDQAIASYQQANALLSGKNIEQKCEIAVNLAYCFQQLGHQHSFEQYRNSVFQLKAEKKWGKAN